MLNSLLQPGQVRTKENFEVFPGLVFGIVYRLMSTSNLYKAIAFTPTKNKALQMQRLV